MTAQRCRRFCRPHPRKTTCTHVGHRVSSQSNCCSSRKFPVSSRIESNCSEVVDVQFNCKSKTKPRLTTSHCRRTRHICNVRKLAAECHKRNPRNRLPLSSDRESSQPRRIVTCHRHLTQLFFVQESLQERTARIVITFLIRRREGHCRHPKTFLP